MNIARQIESKPIHESTHIIQARCQPANRAGCRLHQVIRGFHQDTHVSSLHGLYALLKIGFGVIPKKRREHHVIGATLEQWPVVFNVLNVNEHGYAKVQPHEIQYD